MKLIGKTKGFTLIELLVVVVILSVLAAVAIPQFASSTNESKVAAIDSTLATTRTAIDMYFQDHGKYPAANAATGDVTAAANTQEAFDAQLTKYTDANGDVSNTKDATHVYGPYLRTGLPADPITHSSTVEVISTGSLDLTATAGDPGGWKFDDTTGGIIMNHSYYEIR